MHRSSDSSAVAPAVGDVVVELARPEDDPQIRCLLRSQAMPGRVCLALQREPNAFLAADIEGDIHHTIVVRQARTGKIIGMGSRSVRSVYINGRPIRLGYLGQLRRDPVCLGRRQLLVKGFALCRELRRDDELRFDLTSIIADNSMARAILTKGMPNLPFYVPAGQVLTKMLPVRRVARRPPTNHVQVLPATESHIPDIAACLQRNLSRYQFAPHWTVDDLRSEQRTRGLSIEDFLLAVRGDRVVGCAAVWDQRSFKQVVVAGYAPTLARWQWLINGAATVMGWPLLPPPGAVLPMGYLSHIAVDNNDPKTLELLVRHGCHAAACRGLEYLATGMAEQNPLLAAIRACGRGHEYRSILYLVHWGDAVATIGELDGRIPHVEVAVL